MKLADAAGLAALRRRGRRRQRVAQTACVRASLPICGDHNRTLWIQQSGEAQGWTVFHLPSTPDARRNTVHPAVRPSRRHWRYGRPATPSRVQNCSRHVPACHGHGAVVVSTASPSRRCAQFDGRKLWACTTGGRLRPLGGWRTRFAEGAAAGRPCQACAAWRRGGLRARHGRKSHTATENTASLSVEEPRSVLPLRPRRRSSRPGRRRRRRSQSVSGGAVPNLPAIDRTSCKPRPRD